MFSFKPSVLMILATVLFASLFAGLGRWQIERMLEKQAILDNHHERAQMPVVALPAKVRDFESWRFRKIRIEGAPLAATQFLLDNQVREGRVGFNVLTPFAMTDGRLLLVDRGWVPLGARRDELPDVAIVGTMHSVRGQLYLPFGEAFALGAADAGESGWPRIIQYLDFGVIGQLLKTGVLPAVLRMDPSEAQGYLREWNIIPFSTDKHLAYAVQWFALAIAVVILFIALNLKRTRAGRTSRENG